MDDNEKPVAPGSAVQSPMATTQDHVRHTLEWHGGTTLVVFEEIGPQFAISVCGSRVTRMGPCDHLTHRETLHSVCLTYDDVPVLEKALAEWRAKWPVKGDGTDLQIVMWGGRRMREGKCPASEMPCLACQQLGSHLEPA